MSGCSCVGKIGETPLNRRVGSIIASARYPLSTEREPEEIVPRWSDWPFLFVRVARYTLMVDATRDNGIQKSQLFIKFSDDGAEGRTAFGEKRTPRFTGK